VSASRQKGTRFESEVVGYLRENGHAACERRALSGKNDRGDIAGVQGWTLECKAEKAISLAGYVEEARAEAVNAGTANYAAVVKRRGKGVSEAYVVMPLAVFVKAISGACQVPPDFR
jgi:Holliday junction resolvase